MVREAAPRRAAIVTKKAHPPSQKSGEGTSRRPDWMRPFSEECPFAFLVTGDGKKLGAEAPRFMP